MPPMPLGSWEGAVSSEILLHALVVALEQLPRCEKQGAKRQLIFNRNRVPVKHAWNLFELHFAAVRKGRAAELDEHVGRTKVLAKANSASSQARMSLQCAAG